MVVYHLSRWSAATSHSLMSAGRSMRNLLGVQIDCHSPSIALDMRSYSGGWTRLHDGAACGRRSMTVASLEELVFMSACVTCLGMLAVVRPIMCRGKRWFK